MKKKVAKVFKTHGNGKIEMIKDYQPRGKKGKTTVAIIGSRRSINQAIGNVILKGTKEEQKLVAEILKGDFYEDFDSDKKLLIKY